MSSVGDLVAYLVTDTKQWASGLNKAMSDLQSFQSEAMSLVGGLTASLGGALSASVAIGAAESDIQATRKLQAVLDATGGTAGVTADEINDLATELQRVTKFEDDATVGAAALLATFKNISGANFKQTLGLAQDLAALKDMGLEEAVTALGKALNDPAEAFGKLAKMGIQFTDAQEKAIKVMAETGDMAGAQAELLKALEGTFGGVAKETVSASEQIHLAIGHISEEVGKVLLPFVETLAGAVIPFLYDWGHEIAVVSIAIGGLITVLGAVVVAQKAIAIGQAAILALGGPAGWTALAAGAVAFGVAVGGIELAFQGLTDSAAEASQEIREVVNQIPEVGADFEGGQFGGGDFMAKGEEDARKQIADLKAEVAGLALGYTEAQMAAQKLWATGADNESVKEFARLFDMREKLKKQKQDDLDMTREAESIRKSVRTPEEIFQEEKARLEQLKKAGKIDQETFDRAMAKAGEASGSSPNNSAGRAGALAKGSVDAVSAVLTASREQQGLLDANKKTAENTQQAVAALERIEQKFGDGSAQIVAMAIG